MEIFEDPSNYPYRDGQFLLGCYQKNGAWYPVGVDIEKHALTIATSGSGKGVACLVPNLRLVKDKNVLVIDPKGELATLTANDRFAMGQSVYVIDPFNRSKVDKRFLATYNPLDELDVNSRTIREDIRVIADGIVKRFNPEHARWDNNAVTIIAGLIAFVKTQAPPDKQNLVGVRDLLITSDMEVTAREMAKYPDCGKLMQAASSAILSSKSISKSGEEYLETARNHTEWLDSEEIAPVMSSSSFSLSELKRGNASVYLVLPPDYLDEHANFLRIFVRCALSQMMKLMPDGSERGRQCLFCLDEFYSLGKIDEISKSFGLIRSMGCQLWVFLQDIGQLAELYGENGKDTFFGNSDLHQFFGANDQRTLEYISNSLGVLTADDLSGQVEFEELPKSPTKIKHPVEKEIFMTDMDGVMKRNEMRLNEVRRREGKPRLHPDEVALHIKADPGKVADRMICFIQGRKRLSVIPIPYFAMDQVNFEGDTSSNNDDVAPPVASASKEKPSIGNTIFFGFVLYLAVNAAVIGFGLLLGGGEELSEEAKGFNLKIIGLGFFASFIYAFYRRQKGKLWPF